MLSDDAHGDDRPDFRYGPSCSAPSSAAVDNGRRCLRYRPTNHPQTSFASPPWPAQTIRIARAASYFIAFPIRQANTASPSAEGRLNRPRLKEELRPVCANVCARGIRRRDPEKHESSIRVVGIRRDVMRDRLPGRFRRMLR